jgi:hypothetical protein
VQSPAGQQASIIIQPSRRQQVQQAAQHVADRLAVSHPTAPPATAAAPPSSKIPPWAKEPPPGFYLDVVKDGEVLQVHSCLACMSSALSPFFPCG